MASTAASAHPPKTSRSLIGDAVGPVDVGRQPLLRAFTMPLVPTTLQTSSQPSNPLANELTESLQLATQTLLQISPPHILDPAKEHLSSSFVSIPTPSLSSLLTITKILNYIATNLCPNVPPLTPPASSQFDVGELLQNVGDMTSAFASNRQVEIVLSHSEVASRHVLVSGDECGLVYLLSHVIRRVIEVASKGDTIEIGCSLESTGGEVIASCFEVIHRSVKPASLATFNNHVFQTGLTLLKASMSALPPQPQCRKYRVSIPFKVSDPIPDVSKVSLEEEATRQPFPHIRLASEPTLSELNTFIDSVKGNKVALHASSNTPFAQCLTTHLTAWGMEITHFSTDKGDLLNDSQQNSEAASSNSGSNSPHNIDHSDTLPRFIIIDDDIEELRRRALMFRRPPVLAHASRRPPLIHRPKSHHRGPEVSGSREALPTPIIIYFTSLTKYKTVRDVIQSLEAQTVPSGLFIPEVFALPKPVGPRRFLTALFAAVNKPLLDPLFAPIATSPSTPPTFSSFLDSSSNKSYTPPERETRPRGERTPAKSPRENAGFHSHPPFPGSPLAMEVETAEYFQQTDVHALGETPSSGMLIQSPDGQPAGIFFKPPASKPSKYPSANHGGGSNKLSDRDSTSSRANGPSIETLRRSTRHLSDEFPMARSVPHPITFLRSKTTPYIPGAAVHTSVTPSATELAQRRPPSNSDNGSSRAVSSREVPQTQPLSAEDDAKSPQSNDQAKRIASPPRVWSGLDARKVSSPGTSKLAENTIVPPINVLIVEDNPINQTILTTFMKRKKIKYDTAKDGQEAIDKYKSGNFHLILMDIQMPVMDGIEATRQIRQLETRVAGSPEIIDPCGTGPALLRSPGSGLIRTSVIIVALTASSLQSDRVNALAAGCNDFLTKPVSLVWLNNKIIEWGSLKALQMYAAIAPGSQHSTFETGAPSDSQVARDTKSIEKKASNLGSTVPRRSLLIPSNSYSHTRYASTGTVRSRKASHGSSSSEGGDSLGSSDENPVALGTTS